MKLRILLADDHEIVRRGLRALLEKHRGHRPDAPQGPAEEVAYLHYTSGTTGNPKGVLLTHRNVAYELAAAESLSIITPGSRWVSYLPLAHIAERMFSIYLPIHSATHVHFCPDPAQLVRVVGKVRPNGFFGVPRVWEKILSRS